MDTDNNELVLKVIGSPQPADGSSTIEADATAYIQGDTITYPDPVQIVFELPQGSGAVFTDTGTEKTSRTTLQSSGRIESPVHFKSSKGIENGTLKAYWEIDPANTLQKKPFTFTAKDYALQLNNIHDGEPAYSVKPNVAQAVVTLNGGAVPDGTIVQFDNSNTTSSGFIVSDPSVVNWNTGWIQVKTQTVNGQSVAYANLVASNPCLTAVTAQLTAHPQVASTPASLTFGFIKPDPLSFVVPPPVDKAAADGSSRNKARVVVSNDYIVSAEILKFEIVKGSAKFWSDEYFLYPGSTDTVAYIQSRQLDGSDTLWGADISFTDATAETVTIKVSMRDIPDVLAKTQDFTFT